MAISAIRGQTYQDGTHSLTIAVLDEVDFHTLRRLSSAHGLPDHYNDWLNEREGLVIGLSAAGLNARRIDVDLDRFLSWCKQQSVAPNETTLDRFAAGASGTAISPGDFAPTRYGSSRLAQGSAREFN